MLSGRSARRAVLVLMMLIGLVATYTGGVQQGLDNAIPERHRIYGLPVALSYDMYGLKGYIAYAAIARRFYNTKDVDVILKNDVPTDPAAVESSEGVFFVPADDKGDVTFSRMALAIFGHRVKGLYRLYFLILAGSMVVYTLAFVSDEEKLLVGAVVSAGLLSLLSAFQYGLFRPLVVTFYDVRMFSLITAFALLHLAWLSLGGRKLSLRDSLCAAFQVFVIVLAVHVRSSDIVIVAGLFAWVGIVAVGRSIRYAPPLTIRRGIVSIVEKTSVWPLVFVAIGLCSELQWERVTYHQRYFASNMARHLVWHNVGLGFALHPTLGKPLHYMLSDQSMMNHVAGYLEMKGDRDKLRRIFGDAYSNDTATAFNGRVDVGAFLNGWTSDLAAYDTVARRVILETVRAHPFETAALFMYYKPRYLLAHVFWFMSLGAVDRPSVHPDGHQSPVFGAHTEANGRADYYTPLTGPGAAAFLILVMSTFSQRRGTLLTALVGAVVFFGSSAVPLVAAYPAPPFMGASMFWMMVTLYLSLAVLWSLMPWSSIYLRITGGQPVETSSTSSAGRIEGLQQCMVSA